LFFEKVWCLLGHMPLPTRCPLGHEPVTIVEHVKTEQLVSAYRSRFAVDISEMLDGLHSIAFCRCSECSICFFDPPTPGPPALYAQLSRIPWYYAEGKEEYRLAARRIGKGKSILEVGCGTGAFTRYLTEPRYVGLEYNTDAVKRANADGLDVRPESIEDFAKSHEGEFDVVCSFQVLEHVQNPLSFISACVACARIGGTVMFAVPNSGGYLGVQPDDLLNMPPHHLTWWSEEVFWRIAPQCGLEVVATEFEPLSNNDAYADTRAMRLLMGKLKEKRTFLFEGQKYRALKALAKAGRKIMLAGLYDPHLVPMGHTMLVILRKV
jgi:SAM-dependent methyltransferase